MADTDIIAPPLNREQCARIVAILSQRYHDREVGLQVLARDEFTPENILAEISSATVLQLALKKAEPAPSPAAA